MSNINLPLRTLLLPVALLLAVACGGTGPSVRDASPEPAGNVADVPDLTAPDPGAIPAVPEEADEPPTLESRVQQLSPEARSAVMSAYMQSLIYTDYGHPQKSLEALDQLVASAPEFAYGHVLRGERLLALSEVEAASAAGRAALGIDPDEPEAHHLLAQVALRQGHMSAYRQHLENAVATGTRDAEVRNALAQMYKSEREYAKAAGVWSELITDDPSRAHDYAYQIGYCLRRLDEPDKALEFFNVTLRLRPDHRQALMESADLYREMGEYDLAIENYRHAAAWRGETAIQAYQKIAEIHMEKGETREAVQYLSHVIAADPDYEKGTELLLEAYKQLGEEAYEKEEWTEAIAYLRGAMRLDPDYDTGKKLYGILLFRSAPNNSQRAQEAIEYLKPYVETNPQDGEALRYLAYAYGTAGEFDQAYETAKAIEQPEIAAEVQLVIARSLIARGQEEEGLELVRSVRESGLADQVEYTEAILALAYLEAMESDLDQSIAYLNRLTPPNRRAAGYAFIASRLLTRQRFQDAFTMLDETQKRAQGDVPILTTVGDIWVQVLEYDKAEAAYESVLDATPEHRGVLLRLANLADTRDQLEKVDEYYGRLTQLAPEEGDYHRLWGRVYLERKEFLPDAIEHFTRAVFLEPDDPDAHYALATARGLTDGPETGERILQRFVENQNQSRLAYYTLGNYYLYEDQRPGNYERARQTYQLAILSATGEDQLSEEVLQSQKARAHEGLREFELAENIYNKLHVENPDSLEHLSQLASFYTRRKTKLGRAEQLLTERIAQMDETDDRRDALRFQLVLLYDAQKKFDEAVAAGRELLSDNPFDAATLNLLGYLFAERGRNLDEAEQMIRMALKKDPYNGAYLDSLGWVYFQRGEYEKALEKLELAAKLEGPDPVILEHLGDTYAKLNRWAQSIEAYEKSLAEDPDQVGIREKIDQARAAALAGT